MIFLKRLHRLEQRLRTWSTMRHDPETARGLLDGLQHRLPIKGWESFHPALLFRGMLLDGLLHSTRIGMRMHFAIIPSGCSFLLFIDRSLDKFSLLSFGHASGFIDAQRRMVPHVVQRPDALLVGSQIHHALLVPALVVVVAVQAPARVVACLRHRLALRVHEPMDPLLRHQARAFAVDPRDDLVACFAVLGSLSGPSQLFIPSLIA